MSDFLQRVAEKHPEIRQAARPIKLPRAKVEGLLKDLQAQLRKRGTRPLGNNRNPVASAYIDVPYVRGGTRKVQVAVLTKAVEGASWALGGGFGHRKSTKAPIVLLNLNGTYSGSDLGASWAGEEIFKILMHELAHAADTSAAGHGKVQNKFPGRGDLNPRDYYNNPREVRAFMRELYESMRHFVLSVMGTPMGDKWGLGGTIKRGLKHQEVWVEIRPHLTQKSKNTILKGLVTAFEDDLSKDS